MPSSVASGYIHLIRWGIVHLVKRSLSGNTLSQVIHTCRVQNHSMCVCVCVMGDNMDYSHTNMSITTEQLTVSLHPGAHVLMFQIPPFQFISSLIRIMT